MRSFQLEVDLYMNKEYKYLFEGLESNIQTSTLGSWETLDPCQNLSLVTSENNFPAVDIGSLRDLNSKYQWDHYWKKWQIFENNRTMLASPLCTESASNTGKFECKLRIAEKIYPRFHSKLGVLVKIPLTKVRN